MTSYFEDLRWSTRITYFVLLPDLYWLYHPLWHWYLRGSIYLLCWFQISSIWFWDIYTLCIHSWIWSTFFHGSTVYFTRGHDLHFYILHGSTVYIFHGRGDHLCFHYSWINNVLDLAAMLTSILSMGMPILGREYLTCFCCRYCSRIGLQLLLPNAPSTISWLLCNVFRPSISLMTSHIRGNML